MIRRLAATVLALGLMALPAAAAPEPVPGADEPAFAEAFALWLQDDDAGALPLLAEAAADGNRAAQLLLGLIDRSPDLAGPWLRGLPPAERNALLRPDPEAGSATWLAAAAADLPLAAAWRALDYPDAGPEVVVRFLTLEEPRAARRALLDLAARERRDLITLADHPDFPRQMRYLLWLAWAREGTEADRIEAERAMLHPGDPQDGLYRHGAADPAALRDWLTSSQLALPVAEFCAAHCLSAVAACAEAAFVLIGGHRGLAGLGSPAEGLVSSADFARTPRGQAALLRRALLRHGTDPGPAIAGVSEINACFADQAAAEQARLTGPID